MAKFLNTRKAVSEVEELIKHAGEKLVLVSCSLKLSKDFKELLVYRNSKEKSTTIVFGKQELTPNEIHFLQGLPTVVLKYNEDLHGNCYSNEDRIILTSLNLHEFSLSNNKELGVLIEKREAADAVIFEEAHREIDYINNTSQRFELGTTKPDNTKQPTDHKQIIKKLDKYIGYCIRTGVEIPFNVEKPMSFEAYKAWSASSDKDNPEKFCHFSGDSSYGETTVSNPILKKYWDKAQEIYGLSLSA